MIAGEPVARFSPTRLQIVSQQHLLNKKIEHQYLFKDPRVSNLT